MVVLGPLLLLVLLLGSVLSFWRLDVGAEPSSLFLLPAEDCFCRYYFWMAPWLLPFALEFGMVDYWLCFLGEIDFPWVRDLDRFFDPCLLLLFIVLFLCFFPLPALPFIGDRDRTGLKFWKALKMAGFSTCLYLKTIDQISIYFE